MEGLGVAGVHQVCCQMLNLSWLALHTFLPGMDRDSVPIPNVLAWPLNTHSEGCVYCI